MKRSLHIILAVLAVAMTLFSCSRAKVIPRRTFVKIYADMFLADEWIKDNPDKRRQIDTSLVYEAIFESYGYTTDDYLKSVEHYMTDTERYARMLKKAGDILDQRGTAIRITEEHINKSGEHLKVARDVCEERFLSFSPDSLIKGKDWRRMDSSLRRRFFFAMPDTVGYCQIFFKDTVAVDSSAVDSVKMDSVKVDSVKVDTVKGDVPKPSGKITDTVAVMKEPVRNKQIAEIKK